MRTPFFDSPLDSALARHNETSFSSSLRPASTLALYPPLEAHTGPMDTDLALLVTRRCNGGYGRVQHWKLEGAISAQRERKVAGDDRDVAKTKRGDKRKLVGARSRSYDSIPVYVMDMVRCFHSEP